MTEVHDLVAGDKNTSGFQRMCKNRHRPRPDLTLGQAVRHRRFIYFVNKSSIVALLLWSVELIMCVYLSW